MHAFDILAAGYDPNRKEPYVRPTINERDGQVHSGDVVAEQIQQLLLVLQDLVVAQKVIVAKSGQFDGDVRRQSVPQQTIEQTTSLRHRQQSPAAWKLPSGEVFHGREVPWEAVADPMPSWTSRLGELITGPIVTETEDISALEHALSPPASPLPQ
jgi:hypothetical protein